MKNKRNYRQHLSMFFSASFRLPVTLLSAPSFGFLGNFFVTFRQNLGIYLDIKITILINFSGSGKKFTEKFGNIGNKSKIPR